MSNATESTSQVPDSGPVVDDLSRAERPSAPPCRQSSTDAINTDNITFVDCTGKKAFDRAEQQGNKGRIKGEVCNLAH